MGIFNNSKSGFMNVIRCDEPSYLIWKWRAEGSQKDKDCRENAIRWGSSLRVRDGSVAVFVYSQKDGTYEDFIEGPYDQVLKTGNLPVLANIVGLGYGGGTPFQAEVYFINLAQVVQVRFGVPFFDVYDPLLLDFGVPVAARGTITFKIKDYRQFIKLHQLDEFDLDAFKKQVRDAVARYVKTGVANAPSNLDIPVVQIERGLARIHDAVEPVVKDRLSRDFGVEVTAVDIAAIEFDKESDGYRRLMSVTRDVEAATIQAQTEVNIQNMQDQQRINVENLEGNLRIQREEAQRAQRMATETANIDAFQLEKQAEVGVAGAKALGQMGAHGTTEMDGGSGGGLDPAAMIVGMSVGTAVGQNVASMVGGMMGGLGIQQVQRSAQVPPPIPQVGFHIAVNGVPVGPFPIAQLEKMAAVGTFTSDSLVWRRGMLEWRRAGDVEELAAMFKGDTRNDMPPIPPVV